MTRWTIPKLPLRFDDTGSPAFVGRKRELERLEEAWESVERGDRQAVFLGGEPGSGKSRIAAEMALGLHQRDVVVLLGSSSPDLGAPYEPLVEALNHLMLGTEARALSDVIPDSAAELLRLTPHIRRHRPDLIEPEGGHRAYRRELFAAFVEVVKAVCAERPTAIVLEDMHWASAPTRLLTAHLVEQTPSDRLLVLVTMRNTSPDRSEGLSHTIADLYRLPGASRIDLPPLELDDVERFLRLAVGRGGPGLRKAAALLQDQTGGNPFFLREVLREIPVTGGVEAIRTDALPIPGSIKDTLDRRIRSFQPLDRTVLEYAAVLGSTFEAEDLIDAIEVTAEETLSALDHAVDAGLVGPTGHETYIFQHSLIRQVLLDKMSPSSSAHTHARLALSLERRYKSDPAMAPLLARLFAAGSPLRHRDKSVLYLCRAAEMARRGLAHEEAADLWEQAARASRHSSGQREEMLLLAARSHLLAGDFPEARRIFREVNASEDAVNALRAAIGFEDATWRPGVIGDEARIMLESSIDRIDPDPSDPLYVRALVALGRSKTFSGHLEQSRHIGERALALARQSDDDTLVADALTGMAVRMLTTGEAGDGTDELVSELRDLAVTTGDFALLGPSGTLKASAGYRQSDLGSWMEGWNDVSLAAEKTGEALWRWVDGCYQHCHQFITGAFEGAERTAIQNNEIGYSFGPSETDGPYGLQMFMVRRETGQLETIRSLITGDPAKDGTWTPGLLSVYTELRMREPARVLLERSLELPQTLTKSMTVYPAVIALLSEAALYLADDVAIESMLPHMEEFAGSNLFVAPGVAVFGSANTYLAQMYMALDDLEKAEHHFRTALRMDVAIGSTVHQGWTLANYAVLLEKMGQGERAQEYARRARQLAESIGQHRVLRLLDETVTELPDGLTARERDVLRLLVQGASNKEIGDRLYISQNTAANHVRSILIKTGTPNRTAAAIYASERRLV